MWVKRSREAIEQPPCRHAVYIPAHAAFRLHPGLARGTEAWRLAYNERTCTERSHSRKRNDFGQSASRRRGRPARTAHYFLAAYAQHFFAWADALHLHAEAVFRDILAPHLPLLLGSCNAA